MGSLLHYRHQESRTWPCHAQLKLVNNFGNLNKLVNKFGNLKNKIQIRHQGSSVHRQTIRCDFTMPVAQRVEYFIAKTPVKIEIETPL